MAINGRVYESRTTASILLEWLDKGSTVFEGLHFHGFVAAWNARSSEFVLVRDRYGVETGYYACLEDGIVFADDQQTLLRLGVDPTVHSEAIDAYLTADYFPAPLTPYKAISKVAPGNFVSFRGQEPQVGYWAHYLPVEPVTFAEAMPQIRPILENSLRRMWPSAGDAGLLLSGGIDSAMVAAGITQLLGEPLRAFTFRYDEYDGRLNEGEAARVVSRYLNIPHEEILVTPLGLIDDLDAAVAAYGEPFNWGLHSYRLGPVADHGISALFSGAGADGTGVPKRFRVAYRFNALPGAVRSAGRAAIRAARPLGLETQKKAEWVTRKTDGLGELFSSESELNRVQRATLYQDATLADRGGRLLRSIYCEAAAELPAENRLSSTIMDKRFTSAEAMCAWNRNFTRVNGMEARLPFYDPAYIALGLGVEGATGKDLIRWLARDYLPEEVAHAPKIAQEIPVSHWLRGPLAEPTRERLADLPAPMTEVFDPAGVRTAVERHISGLDDLGWQIISLLTIASWYRQQA